MADQRKRKALKLRGLGRRQQRVTVLARTGRKIPTLEHCGCADKSRDTAKDAEAAIAAFERLSEGVEEAWKQMRLA